MTYKQFAKKHKITLAYDYTDHNPNMPEFDGDHYKVTLKRGRKRMTLTYSKGYGHTGEPPAVDEVLCCLAQDVGYEGESFEDFCSNFGYDPDSRKASRIFEACNRQTQKLRNFLGDTFEELMGCEE